jgi:acyl-CoA synthetase (AMP-forming)/AMP-acid ligase II
MTKYDLSSVVDVLTGAAPMGPEALQTLYDVYPRWNIFQGYGKLTRLYQTLLMAAKTPSGLTEAGPTVAMTPIEDIWALRSTAMTNLASSL